MNSFNVDALSHWWNLNMSDSKKPYWVLHRSAGGRPGPTIANYGNEDANASWTALVETIQNAITQGVYEFWVVGRPGGVNDTKGKVEYQLRATGWNTGGGGNIAGMYGGGYQQSNTTPAVDIAGIKAEIRNELEDKYKLQNEMQIMKIQHERQLEKMEEMVAGISETKKNNFDRFLEVLENPEAAKGFIGMIQMVKGMLTPQGLPTMAAAGGGIGNVPGRRPAPQQVHEMPAEPDTKGETDNPDETQGPVIYEGLEGEYDCAIEAVNMLHEAGWETPGELLQKVAKFAIANPAMAQNLIGSL